MVRAEEPTQMKTGIHIGTVDVSGMTAEEARAAVENYVLQIQGMPVILRASEGNEVTVKASDFGMEWTNQEVVEDDPDHGAVRSGQVRASACYLYPEDLPG